MRILDTTLRDGLMSEMVALTLSDKIEIASLLDRAGIEIIEMAHITEKEIGEELKVAEAISTGKVCVLTDTNPDNIKNAIDFTDKIKGGVIHIYTMANFPSDALNKRLQEIKKAVSHAKDHARAVQWTGFDGNRAEYDLFQSQIETAIQSGAKTISVPDSMGVQDPEAFESLVKRVIGDFKSEAVEFSVHCHDDLGYALENTMAGIRSGVQQVELTIAGVGARKGNCNLIDLIRSEEISCEYDQELLKKAEDVLLSAISHS